ncbi:hypothetical protein DdX_06707 [Ditylenchus destructor]|uniref:Uncharacterized protein n=1 Tax=Ditylenchus destructor TaxID=166010 RepID=A0AAD4N531_9BILA|nr:hypothetical protein DdX_06707 [Ditylenchus destructor]
MAQGNCFVFIPTLFALLYISTITNDQTCVDASMFAMWPNFHMAASAITSFKWRSAKTVSAVPMKESVPKGDPLLANLGRHTPQATRTQLKDQKSMKSILYNEEIEDISVSTVSPVTKSRRLYVYDHNCFFTPINCRVYHGTGK